MDAAAPDDGVVVDVVVEDGVLYLELANLADRPALNVALLVRPPLVDVQGRDVSELLLSATSVARPGRRSAHAARLRPRVLRTRRGDERCRRRRVRAAEGRAARRGWRTTSSSTRELALPRLDAAMRLEPVRGSGSDATVFRRRVVGAVWRFSWASANVMLTARGGDHFVRRPHFCSCVLDPMIIAAERRVPGGVDQRGALRMQLCRSTVSATSRVPTGADHDDLDQGPGCARRTRPQAAARQPGVATRTGARSSTIGSKPARRLRRPMRAPASQSGRGKPTASVVRSPLTWPVPPLDPRERDRSRRRGAHPPTSSPGRPHPGGTGSPGGA